MEFMKSYLDIMVFGTLGFMSFVMVWCAVERVLYYRKADLSKIIHREDLNIQLTQNLTIISSIGSNAPYIGLLGTVMGILITFYDLGLGGQIDPSRIMMGLALALKATAAGLFVAIPAILIYNGLLRKVDVLTADWKIGQSPIRSSS